MMDSMKHSWKRHMEVTARYRYLRVHCGVALAAQPLGIF